MNRSFAAPWLGGLCLGVALIVTGCDGSSPTGTVAGSVKFNGAAVTTGDVNFISKSGKAAQAKLDPTGGYKIDSPLEAGEYKVYVTPPVMEPTAPGTKSAAPPSFPVPRKFQDAATSGVTVTVKSGSNDIPVDLKG